MPRLGGPNPAPGEKKEGVGCDGVDRAVVLLESLSNACGLAGGEDEVRDVLRRALEPEVCEIYTDTIGNLVCRKGSGPVRVMLDAHMDEVGLVVAGYTDDGLIRFKESGGVDARVLPGRAVLVGRRKVSGVVGAPAVHLLEKEDREKVIPSRDLFVDVGARSRDEAASVAEPGDPIYFATRFERLSNTIIKGKALDDRIGCAVVASVLFGPQLPGLTVLAAFTVQEEAGLRGAEVAAFHLAPHVALAVDATSSSDVPGVEPPDVSSYLGQGPVIYVMDGGLVMHRGLREHLVSLAERHAIPYQFRRLTTAGTDSDAIFRQRTGVPTCSLSTPCRYIHSPASLADLDDVRHTARLVRLLLESLDKEEFTP